MEADKQPKTWKEMSFDMHLLFGFHICMMALMMAGAAFSATFVFKASVATCAALTVTVLSIQNRRKCQWHWPGSNWKDILGALIAAALALYFLGAMLPGTTIRNPRLFPWLSAGAGIMVFGVLNALNFVQTSKAGFERHCGNQKPIEALPARSPAPQIPVWRKFLAWAFQIYFLIVWIMGVTFFWRFNSAFAHGSRQTTETQTEPLTNHGHTVYITLSEKHMIKFLETAWPIGLVSVFAIAAILHFALKIKIFNRQTPDSPPE